MPIPRSPDRHFSSVIRSAMSSRQTNDGRRIYVFFAVALAAFVLGIVAVGFKYHGFMPSSAAIAAEAAEKAAAAEAARQQAAAEAEAKAAAEAATREAAERRLGEAEAAKAELETAERKSQQAYAAAREASAAALAEFETSQSKFLDFLGTHFGELTADIPTAHKYMSAVEEHAAKVRELTEQAAKERELAEQAAKERELAAKAAAERAAQRAAEQKQLAKAMAANPQWTELREKLEHLQQQRKKLLDTLTASHPAVVAVDLDITEVEQQLQSVPAQIATEVPQPEQIAAAVETPAESREAIEAPQIKQPAMVPAPTIDLAAWASRWSTEDSQFHELTEHLNAAKEEYRSALEQEETARQKHAEAASAVAAVVLPPAPEPATVPAAAPAAAPEEVAEPSGARPWRTIPWCGVVAVVLGLIVAGKAVVSEPVFRAAAAVRQALELPVLGLLSRGPAQLPREQPQREPQWVRRTVLSAELWLAAIVLLLAATGWADQQFWRDLIVDPLAACSRKFFC